MKLKTVLLVSLLLLILCCVCIPSASAAADPIVGKWDLVDGFLEAEIMVFYADGTIDESGIFFSGSNWWIGRVSSSNAGDPEYTWTKDPEIGYYKGTPSEKGRYTRIEVNGDTLTIKYPVGIEAVYTRDLSYQPPKGGGIFESIMGGASAGAGEEGYGVPLAVITGIAAAGAAAAGAGLGGGSSENGNDNNNRRSTYRMYVRKDFGNKIRADTPEQTVYARMAEITEDGEEVYRPDLSSAIVFSSAGGITVGSQSFTGDYMGALISAEKENIDKQGTLRITFTGEGGTFENNLIFEILGDPYIKFTEQGAYQNMTLTMLYGDNGDYETEIELVDLLEPPTSVTVQLPDGSPFSGETEKIDDTRYKILLHNTSSVPEKQTAQKESYAIDVLAENEKEKLSDWLEVELRPEGLSIRDIKLDEEGHALISSYIDKETQDTTEIIPTEFVVELYVKSEENGKTKAKKIDEEQFKPVFGELKGTEEKTNVLVQKFEYEIKDTKTSGTYQFAPKEQIAEPQTPYYVTLPISADYDGQTYPLDVPVRLLGDTLSAKAAWDKEYSLLKRRIQKFGMSQEASDYLRSRGRNLSTNELRLLSKKIIYDSVAYYTKEGQEFTATADSMDEMINDLSLVKWIGDQAFSFLATLYATPAGEAILSPAKDLLMELIGECVAGIISGDPINFEEVQVGTHISEAVENYVMTTIDFDKLKSVADLKKVGAVIAGLCIFNLLRHWYLDKDDKGNRDFYAAVVSSFSDISVNACKVLFGQFFKKSMQNPNSSFSKIAGTWCGKWVKSTLPDINKGGSSVLTKYMKEESATLADAISKYLEGIVGSGASYVTSTMVEAAVSGQRAAYTVAVALGTDENGFSYTAYINPLKCADNLLNFIFDELFAMFPFPAAETGEAYGRMKDPIYMNLKDNTREG